ncbi:ABC transporter substrate-binding protein [Bradyrhizobium prioriisuperbiae]|uniref:ABC transporter substrate-binding protein n=1 Tax=Bradyrhizobium prioriisuperbiae TaxID=2854389 RepID=UPI0028EB87EA|nr:ABC transporter substrate-binding protein [Bradyrhizobium prioritasuperba]
MPTKVLKRLLPAALIIAMIASSATSALAQTPVKIGIGFGIGFLPTFILRDMNLIEKHAKAAGLDVKTEYQRISGSSAMQDAVLSGSVDLGTYGVAAMLFAWDKARNTPQQIFGIAGVNSSPLILVTNKPEVKKISDLAPTDKIAMPALVSPQMYALQMVSEKIFGPGQEDKLKPQVVALPHPESLNAMLSGGTEVKAYFAPPPFAQIALESGKAHAITSTEEAFGGRSSFLIVGATKRYLDANPKMIEVVVKALTEASDLIRNEPDKAAELYLKAEPSKLFDQAKVAALLKANPDDFGVAVYGVKQTADFMARQKLIKTVPANFKDVFIGPVQQTASN